MRIDRAHPLLQRMDQFLYSPAFFLLLGGLTILANVFCLELYAYTFILLIGIYVCLFSRDLLPIFPVFACGYISPSMGNNPGRNENSIFSLSGSGIYLAILLVLFAVSMVYRLVTDKTFGGKKFLHKKRKLLSGMLVLGICYAISGLASGQWQEYGLRNLLFAFIQLVAVAGLYYLLSGAVQWEYAPKGYLYWTGICVGYVLLAELVGIYFSANVIVDGKILRENIYTGWGNYNSMGALFTLIIPLPFFLTDKKKTAVFAYLSAFLFCIGLLFTCSRGSILFGVVIYVAAYLLSLIHSRHARSLKLVHAFIIAIPILALAMFHEELLRLFEDLVRSGLKSPQRLETYAQGIKQFLRFPVFGGSFFPVDCDLYVWATSEEFVALFPPRWHNTFVQLLATGGVTCLAAYLFHRVQTIKLFIHDFNTGKLFAGLSIAALLMTSMLDCHFFNVGPVLLYSGMLAFVEFQLNQPNQDN